MFFVEAHFLHRNRFLFLWMWWCKNM